MTYIVDGDVTDAVGLEDVAVRTLGPGFKDGGPRKTPYAGSSVDIVLSEVADATSVRLVLDPLQNTPASGISDASEGAILVGELLNMLADVPLPARVADGVVQLDSAEDGDAVVSEVVEFWKVEAGMDGTKVGEDSPATKLVEVDRVLLTSGLVKVDDIGRETNSDVDVVKPLNVVGVFVVELTSAAEVVDVRNVEAAEIVTF